MGSEKMVLHVDNWGPGVGGREARAQTLELIAGDRLKLMKDTSLQVGGAQQVPCGVNRKETAQHSRAAHTALPAAGHNGTRLRGEQG